METALKLDVKVNRASHLNADKISKHEGGQANQHYSERASYPEHEVCQPPLDKQIHRAKIKPTRSYQCDVAHLIKFHTFDPHWLKPTTLWK